MCRGYRNAVALVTSNSFMDDFLAGVEDGNGAIDTYYEFNALIRTIELPMAKWATSCQEPKEIWRVEVQEIQRTTQPLGVDWIPRTSLIEQQKGSQLRDYFSKPLPTIFKRTRHSVTRFL